MYTKEVQKMRGEKGDKHGGHIWWKSVRFLAGYRPIVDLKLSEWLYGPDGTPTI